MYMEEVNEILDVETMDDSEYGRASAVKLCTALIRSATVGLPGQRVELSRHAH